MIRIVIGKFKVIMYIEINDIFLRNRDMNRSKVEFILDMMLYGDIIVVLLL